MKVNRRECILTLENGRPVYLYVYGKKCLLERSLVQALEGR